MENVFEKLKDAKKVTIGELTCYISKIPAFYAQGILMRGGEALASLDLSKLPEDVITQILSYTAVENRNGVKLVLNDIDLVNEMIDNPKDLIELELKMVEYNFGFFFNGSLREVFAPLAKLVQGATKTSTPSAAS